MKLTKENYELIMFDLLEGNLPEHERESVLVQIDNNPFYKREWELFQSTVLHTDESIVFENKDSLIKKDKVVVIPLRVWVATAIAACLVLALFISFPSIKHPTMVNDQPEIQETPSVIEYIPSPEVEIAENTDVLQTENRNLAVQTQYKPVEHTQDSVPASMVQPALIYGKSIAGIPFDREIASDYPKINFIQTEGVTNSGVERIAGKVYHTAVMLQQPRMSISPNWKEKNIEIELETTGYYALARLDPFKKK